METDSQTKQEIIQALAHPEASDGLYFRNFANLHEEDERPAVSGEQEQILEALGQLIKEGKVKVDDQNEEPIFFLNSNS